MCAWWREIYLCYTSSLRGATEKRIYISALVLDSRNSQSFLEKPATNSLPLSFSVKHDFQLVGQRGILRTIKINSLFAERLLVATTIWCLGKNCVIENNFVRLCSTCRLIVGHYNVITPQTHSFSSRTRCRHKRIFQFIDFLSITCQYTSTTIRTTRWIIILHFPNDWKHNWSFLTFQNLSNHILLHDK